MTTIMALRWHPTSLLLVLPNERAIKIAGHLAATSKWPMDDLCSLWVTYSSMRHIYGNPTVGRHFSLVRFRCGTMWDNPIDYEALLASLTQVGNLETYFLTRIFGIS